MQTFNNSKELIFFGKIIDVNVFLYTVAAECSYLDTFICG